MAKQKKCRKCPDEPEPIEVIPYPRKQKNVAAHGAQLWQQATYTCSSIIEMMCGYSLTGVAGEQIPQLHRLSERLQQVIQNCEKRNANSSTPQR
jgi:hypothetical protein